MVKKSPSPNKALPLVTLLDQEINFVFHKFHDVRTMVGTTKKFHQDLLSFTPSKPIHIRYLKQYRKEKIYPVKRTPSMLYTNKFKKFIFRLFQSFLVKKIKVLIESYRREFHSVGRGLP